MPPAYVVIGPPGSGKTTVGKLLAETMQVEFRDTDRDVAERAGKSIPEIFLEDGEPIFRQFEEVAVREAVQEHAGVLALGGGAVVSMEVQKLLRDCQSPVVFLDVSVSAAAPRVGFNRDRPLLLINPRAQWLALMEKRRGIYESLASITVKTDDLTPAEVVQRILEQAQR